MAESNFAQILIQAKDLTKTGFDSARNNALQFQGALGRLNNSLSGVKAAAATLLPALAGLGTVFGAAGLAAAITSTANITKPALEQCALTRRSEKPRHRNRARNIRKRTPLPRSARLHLGTDERRYMLQAIARLERARQFWWKARHYLPLLLRPKAFCNARARGPSPYISDTNTSTDCEPSAFWMIACRPSAV